MKCWKRYSTKNGFETGRRFAQCVVIAAVLGAFLVGSAVLAASEEAAKKLQVEAYSMLTQAERDNNSGRAEEAVLGYREAMRLYEKLSSEYPDWQPDIVSHYKKYCESQLEALSGTEVPVGKPVEVPISKPVRKTRTRRKTTARKTSSGKKSATEVYREKYSALLQENKYLRSRVAELESTADTSGAGDNELRQKVVELTSENAQLHQQLADAHSRVQSAMADQVTANEVQLELQGAVKQNQELLRDIQSLDREFAAMENDLATMAKEREEMGVQMEALMAERVNLQKDLAGERRASGDFQRTVADMEKRLRAVSDQKAASDAEVAELKGRLRMIEDRRKEWQAEADRALSTAERDRKEMAGLRMDITELQRALEEARKRQGEAQSQVKALERQIGTLEKGDRQWRAEIDRERQAAAEARKSAEQIATESAALRARLQNAEGRRSDYEKRIADLMKDNGDLKQQLSVVKNDYLKLAESASGNVSDIAGLQKQIEEAKAEAAQVREAKETLEQKIAEMEKIVAGANTELEGIRGLQKHIKAMERERTTLAREKEQFSQKMEGLEAEKSDLNGRYKQATETIKTLEGKLREANGATEQVTKQNTGLERKLASLQDDIARVNALKGEIKTLKREKVELQKTWESKLAEERKNAESMAGKMAELDKQITTLELQKNDAESKIQQAELRTEALTRARTVLKDQLNEKIRSAAEEIQTATREKEELARQLAKLEQELRPVRELKRELKSAMRERDEMKRSNATLGKKIDSIMSEKAQVSDSLEKTKAAQQELSDKVRQLAGDLAQVTRERDGIAKKLGAAEGELGSQRELQGQIKRLERDKSTLIREKATLQQKIAGLIDERNRFEEAAGRKNADAKDLQAKVDASQAKMEKLIEERAGLVAKIETLEKELAEATRVLEELANL